MENRGENCQKGRTTRRPWKTVLRGDKADRLESNPGKNHQNQPTDLEWHPLAPSTSNTNATPCLVGITVTQAEAAQVEGGCAVLTIPLAKAAL